MKKIMLFAMALCCSVAMFAAKTYYLIPNSNWKSDGAKFAMYFYNNETENAWSDIMEKQADGAYKAEGKDGYSKMIFVRLNSAATEANWTNKWNQSKDLDVPTNDDNLYTVAEGAWDKGDGTWSVYTAAEKKDITYKVAVPDGTVDCYIAGDWDATGSWVWKKMTKVNAVDHQFEYLATDQYASFEYKYCCAEDWAYVEKTATDGDVANRTYKDAIDVVAKWAKTPKAADTREKREIVLVPGELKSANPTMIVYAWTAGKESFDAKMEVKKEGEDTVAYVTEVPKELDSLIFVRAKDGLNGWDDLIWGEGTNVWNKSEDQLLSADCDTATFATWDQGEDGNFTVTWCGVIPEPSVDSLTLYFMPNDNWKTAGAKFAMYFFKSSDNNKNGWSDFMEILPGGAYQGKIPEGYDMLIFVRLKNDATEANWDNKWNQSTDLDLPSDGSNYFTLYPSEWDDLGGAWSTYVAPEKKDITYKVAVPEGTVDCYIAGDWDGNGNWTWKQMTKVNEVDYQFEYLATDQYASFAYKYCCGESWAYVEVTATDEEVPNRSYKDAIDVVAKWAKTPKGPDTREKREIVLVPGELKTDNPTMIVYAWTAGKESFDAKMEVKKEGGDTVAYVTEVPKELDSLIFVRAKDGLNGWDDLIWGEGTNVWNQSEDQLLSADCDTASFAAWDNGEGKFTVIWCGVGPVPVVDGWYIKLPASETEGDWNWRAMDEQLDGTWSHEATWFGGGANINSKGEDDGAIYIKDEEMDFGENLFAPAVGTLCTFIWNPVANTLSVNYQAQGIENVYELNIDAPMYNVLGVEVDADFHGIVIQNGHKFIR